MLFNFSREEELSLTDARKYVTDSLSTLVYFVENVELKDSMHMSSFKFQMCAQAFVKASKTFECKVIRPLKRLCLRMLQKGIGLNILHLIFIKLINKYQLFPEAISVIEKKVLPKEMTIQEYCEYMFHCGNTYVTLKKYETANECFQKIVSNGLRGLKEVQYFIAALKFHILLNAILGKHNVSRQHLRNIYEEMTIIDPVSSLADKNAVDLQIFSDITEKKQLKPQQLAHMNNDGTLQLYREVDLKMCELKSKVAQEIRDKNQRIKTSELGNTSLNDFKVMNGINKHKQLCKYDVENKILTFNHNTMTPQQINSLISRCYEMYEIVSAQRDMEEKHSRLSGMLSKLGGRMMF